MTEIFDWVVCGRKAGTASGWDQGDTFVLQLYDFAGGEGYTGPSGKFVTFDFEHGRVEVMNDNGEITASVDLIEAISGCPKGDI